MRTPDFITWEELHERPIEEEELDAVPDDPVVFPYDVCAGPWPDVLRALDTAYCGNGGGPSEEHIREVNAPLGGLPGSAPYCACAWSVHRHRRILAEDQRFQALGALEACRSPDSQSSVLYALGRSDDEEEAIGLLRILGQWGRELGPDEFVVEEQFWRLLERPRGSIIGSSPRIVRQALFALQPQWRRSRDQSPYQQGSLPAVRQLCALLPRVEDGFCDSIALGDAALRPVSPGPSARTCSGLAYVPPIGGIVLFGGLDTSPSWTVLNDVWRRVGDEWADASQSPAPPPRKCPALVYDSCRDRLVMFGGSTDHSMGEALTDTWELDVEGWTRIDTTAFPHGAGPQATFDAARCRVVLLAGDPRQLRKDGDPVPRTWEYDGSDWTAQTLTPSPPPRADHALAFDSSSQTVVLFGGRGETGDLNDSWEYDGAAWSRIETATSPSPRYSHQLVYDSTRRKLVLHGGARFLPADDQGGILVSDNDTWELDRRGWTRIDTPGPTPRLDSFSLVYDAARERTILFGGVGHYGLMNGTWEYDGRKWAHSSDVTP